MSLWEDSEELSSEKGGEECPARREQHMPRHGEKDVPLEVETGSVMLLILTGQKWPF